MRWVFGLNADIDQNGVININAAQDNVYNSALGGELQSVLSFWNNADSQPDGTICITLPAGEQPPTLFETLQEQSPYWL